MTKKLTKSQLTKRLDKEWSIAIRNRAGNRCEYCGRTHKMLNAHHLEGRRSLATRWDLDNGIALCPTHHTFGDISAHSQSRSGRLIFDQWLQEYKGMDVLVELAKKTRQIVKMSYTDYVLTLSCLIEINKGFRKNDNIEEIARNINS